MMRNWPVLAWRLLLLTMVALVSAVIFVPAMNEVTARAERDVTEQLMGWGR